MNQGADKEEQMQLLFMLGLTVREAANVELQLRLIAAQLTESPHGVLLMAGETVTRLVDLCRNLAADSASVSSEQEEELRTLTTECKVAFQRRDQYVHGAWAQDGVSGAMLTMRSRRNKTEPQFAPMNVEDLTDLSHKLNGLANNLTGWLLKIMAG
ncbi:hypothetical protein [Streptomyces antimycoticus]|uniref:hypothetical protein n=1 Tax=Streptomyces antimycoticus TaxID=68175 RepID=UPI0034057213